MEQEEVKEKPEIIIKEKKEAKRSKSWGRRSTRTKKSISYRFVNSKDAGLLFYSHLSSSSSYQQFKFSAAPNQTSQDQIFI